MVADGLVLRCVVACVIPQVESESGNAEGLRGLLEHDPSVAVVEVVLVGGCCGGGSCGCGCVGIELCQKRKITNEKITKLGSDY